MAAVRKHAHHVIVASNPKRTDSGQRLADARAATAIAAAIATLEPGAIAVWWTDSGVIQPAAEMRALGQQELALDLWLDVRMFGDGAGATGAQVRGLVPFIGRDLTVNPTSALPAADVARRAVDISAYLIRRGPVLADGDTVGIPETERLRVRLGVDPHEGRPAVIVTVEKVA